MFNGKNKAITFSFDDGNTDDVRLVELFKRYGLKATFNLNSGSLSYGYSWEYWNKTQIHHLNYFDYPDLYDGFEIACHTHTHPDLTRMVKATVLNEWKLDRKILEFLYGCKIEGAALPYGKWDATTYQCLKELGFLYCRTTKVTHKFDLPDDLMIYPTCKFIEKEIMDLANEFLRLPNDKPALFYIYGHSYELETEDHWQKFEDFCKLISFREDICYETNINIIKNCLNDEKSQNEIEGKI
ncbi:MAG: polysaccharide deacetylase family protein [Clostridia bacterium]|nr:polysaccharide deacetylase family protein [Clostridia bacterium]